MPFYPTQATTNKRQRKRSRLGQTGQSFFQNAGLYNASSPQNRGRSVGPRMPGVRSGIAPQQPFNQTDQYGITRVALPSGGYRYSAGTQMNLLPDNPRLRGVPASRIAQVSRRGNVTNESTPFFTRTVGPSGQVRVAGAPLQGYQDGQPARPGFQYGSDVPGRNVMLGSSAPLPDHLMDRRKHLRLVREARRAVGRDRRAQQRSVQQTPQFNPLQNPFIMRAIQQNPALAVQLFDSLSSRQNQRMAMAQQNQRSMMDFALRNRQMQNETQAQRAQLDSNRQASLFQAALDNGLLPEQAAGFAGIDLPQGTAPQQSLSPQDMISNPSMANQQLSSLLGLGRDANAPATPAQNLFDALGLGEQPSPGEIGEVLLDRGINERPINSSDIDLIRQYMNLSEGVNDDFYEPYQPSLFQSLTGWDVFPPGRVADILMNPDVPSDSFFDEMMSQRGAEIGRRRARQSGRRGF